MKTKEEIEKYVQDWIDSHESDTFIKNEHGVYLYSSGAVSLNIKVYFEMLLEDFIQDNQSDKKQSVIQK